MRFAILSVGLVILFSFLIIRNNHQTKYKLSQNALEVLDSIEGFNIYNTDSTEFTVKIKNPTPYFIKILNIKTSCGCTVASLSVSELAPNKVADLKLSLDNSIKGRINVQVIVEYLRSSSSEFLVIPVNGWNLAPDEFYLSSSNPVVFGVVQPNKKVYREVTLYGTKATLESLIIKTSADNITTELKLSPLSNKSNAKIASASLKISMDPKIDSLENGYVNITSHKGISSRVPLIWKIEKVDQLSSIDIYLGRLQESSISVQINLGELDSVDIIESSHTISNVESIVVNQQRKITINIALKPDQKRIQTGTFLIKSVKSDSQPIKVIWTGYVQGFST